MQDNSAEAKKSLVFFNSNRNVCWVHGSKEMGLVSNKNQCNSWKGKEMMAGSCCMRMTSLIALHHGGNRKGSGEFNTTMQ